MRSLGGSRAVLALAVKVIAAVGVVVGALLITIEPFGARYNPSVEVHDEAGVLQVAAVRDSLAQLEFRKPVRLEVLTLSGVRAGDNFNMAVLEWARANEPDWISASNPNYWADGLVVLAVSPDGRWVGTYFGEDVKVDLSLQQDIQGAGKGAFVKADWAGGLLNMGESAANLIGRGIPNQLLRLGIAGGAIVASTSWMGALLSFRRRGRNSFAAAQRHYASVTTDWDTTEVLARTIPDDEPHGAQVLTRFDWFQRQYHDLTAAFNDFGTPRGAAWFNLARARRAEDLQRRAGELDSMDDTIAHASALLTMSSTWADAWANEIGPLHEDLAAFDELCDSVDEEELGVDTAPDRAWIRAQQRALATMTVELEERRRSPSAALDALDRMADRTRQRAKSLADRAIDADRSAHGDERRERYRSASETTSDLAYHGMWEFGSRTVRYSPSSTIRLNPSSAGRAAATAAAGSSSRIAPLEGLVVGYNSASSYTPSSSSSFGSSGGGSSSFSGGFSGAGSSSRF